MSANLLLLSNSTIYGKAYLEHALDAVAEFLGERRIVHFAPFALADHDAYTQRVQKALQPLNVKVMGLHTLSDCAAAVEDAEVLFVGGGNTFRLSQSIQKRGLLEPVRRRVATGELAYLGSSAGTNYACPTIRTTNDMPIVEPSSLKAFGLLPFQINPHYQDQDANSQHMGETREQRISQFLEENDVPVLGMREGAWLRGQNNRLTLRGETGAILFRRGAAPTPYKAGDNLTFLLNLPSHFDAPAKQG